jgi:hypothetical protein
MARPPKPRLEPPDSLYHGTKYIALTKGQFALVDEGDFEELSRFNWYASWAKSTQSYYAVRRTGTESGRHFEYMHRYILGLGWRESGDHINRNTLDNRRVNLRPCTNQQNIFNQGISSRNRSGFKGVSFFKTRNKWRAVLSTRGEYRHIGYFDSPEDAARAYDSVVTDLHGEFAWTNFRQEIS